MSRIARAFERYERWRIERCAVQSAGFDLAVAGLFVGAGVVTLWLSLRGVPARTASFAITGALLFSVGWSGAGRAFWERQVRKLALEIERLRQGG